MEEKSVVLMLARNSPLFIDRIPSFARLISLSILIAGVGMAGCSSRESRNLDIPEGAATDTLKVFAKQAQVEILFDLQSVAGIETRPVKGNYKADAALRIMLEDTPLGVDFEEETGAYAVFRKESG